MKLRKGKRLGGKPPRRPGRHLRAPAQPTRIAGSFDLLAVLVVALVVLGGVAGFAWASDRQIRGGILRQRAEAEGRPDWVPITALPQYVPLAFAAVVDPTLLPDEAVRPREGGATLARDLVSEVHQLGGSLRGTARALVMGPILARHLSRRQMLELYLNRTYFGSSNGYPVYGIYHAAEEYLGKEPQQLTLGETATLAGLLLEPRIDDPDGRAGAVGARREEVLRVLQLGGLITPEQYQQATAEPLPFQPGLREMPMTRRPDLAVDTSVIRLPPELIPKPDSTRSPAR